ncbi:MAG: ISAzo13 family transposase [Verrucomicrobia bacterium]|nr:ISAzo13 family transposase [Verrucomicrobiota bacterium]
MTSMVQQIRTRYELLCPALAEKQRRLYLAAEARALGRGGISKVAKATGTSRNTIAAGLKELDHSEPPPLAPSPNIAEADSDDGEKKKRRRTRGGRLPVPAEKRHRKPGGGRKRTTTLDPTLKSDLEALLEPFAAGDPCSPLQWTCKSVSALTDALNKQGHKTSTRMVHELLIEMRYTMQGNKKTKESGSHPDRNAQFLFINAKTKEFQTHGEPVISVDTKKKELVGQFANKGSTWRPEGCPEEVNVHDFMDPEKGRASPYGIYDQAKNLGFVNVGLSADTSEFAVESIRRWWLSMGKETYSEASRLYIVADGGGSNCSRVRLWKTELQRFADESGLVIAVSHFPPGTSKWNKIEHRMFSHISQNWRGRPLTSIETIVSLIGSTKTKPGLTIKAVVDANHYAKGIKITDAQMNALDLRRNTFHGEWNYEVHPTNN